MHISASFHGKEDVPVLASPHLLMGTSLAILCKVCGMTMLMDEELPGKAKHVELHYSQQDDRHVSTKKVLELVKVLSVLYTCYDGV